MGIHILSVSHSDQGLDAVAEASRTTPSIVDEFLKAGVIDGAVTISTCNRVDIVVDSAEFPVALNERLDAVTSRSGRDAVAYLFRVASGLDSMVIGEREIVGQVRRAAEVATQRGTITPALSRLFQSSSAVSRKVAAKTSLAGHGRSIVHVALDLAKEVRGDLGDQRAILFGTGSYAGATVSALRDHGVREIGVHSASGRAEAFCEGHGARPIVSDTIDDELAHADLIVSCRGSGQPVLTADQICAVVSTRGADSPLIIVDLALVPDIEIDDFEADQVVRIGLDNVSDRLPAVQREDIDIAEAIIADAVTTFVNVAHGADVDRAIVNLRNAVDAIVEEECATLSHLSGDEAARTARALHHLAARLVNAPCRTARAAVADGNAHEYLEALERVLGIGAENV